MPDYQRVPADIDAVSSAREVKDEYSETWADVFRFYAEHRGTDGDTPELNDALTVDESQIAKRVTDDLLSQLPPKIAEELQP